MSTPSSSTTHVGFRAETELVEQIDRLAKEMHGSRSEVIRMLLRQCLEDDLTRANIIELKYAFTARRDHIFRVLANEMAERFPVVAAEILQESD